MLLHRDSIFRGMIVGGIVSSVFIYTRSLILFNESLITISNENYTKKTILNSGIGIYVLSMLLSETAFNYFVLIS